jgi:hypothetical protein
MMMEGLTAARALWRKKGPIGRLHNVCVFIRSSPQRRRAFEARSRALLAEHEAGIDGASPNLGVADEGTS